MLLFIDRSPRRVLRVARSHKHTNLCHMTLPGARASPAACTTRQETAWRHRPSPQKPHRHRGMTAPTQFTTHRGIRTQSRSISMPVDRSQRSGIAAAGDPSLDHRQPVALAGSGPRQMYIVNTILTESSLIAQGKRLPVASAATNRCSDDKSPLPPPHSQV